MTPGTNKKVGEALKLTYSSWSVKSSEENIPSDPRKWSLSDVRIWLQWTVGEFSLTEAVFEELMKELQVRKRNGGFAADSKKNADAEKIN